MPSTVEWWDVLNWLQFLWLGGCENAMTYLKLPMAGYREYDTTNLDNRWTVWCYWTSTPNDSTTAYILSFNGTDISVENSITRSAWLPIRAFKNTIALPDSTWTVLSWTLWSWWVFWNQTEWLITVTWDWELGYTIMDKNLWATQVWNYWDAEWQEETCGKTYQWWNNYWFDWDDNLVILDPSHTKRDVTGYWPTNYYSNSYWVAESPWQNSTSNGNDLWWNVSNSTHQECETTPLTISADTTVLATKTDLSWKQDKATSGSTAPSTTPSYIWQQYVDTTNNKLYVATWTTSSSDWTEVWSWWSWWWGNVIAMTQQEYNALSTAEKNDGKLRIITDAPTEDISVDWSNVANKKVDLSTQTWNLSELKFWIWTTSAYQNLDSYDNNTVYICKKVIS